MVTKCHPCLGYGHIGSGWVTWSGQGFAIGRKELEDNTEKKMVQGITS